MVGVPGRSRACQQCKVRRVACDLQQPGCNRCVKAKRQCEYAQGRIFVLNEERSHKTVYKKADGLLANREHQNLHGMRKPVQAKSEERKTPDSEASDGGTQAVMLIKQPKCGQFNQQALLSYALDSAAVHKSDAIGGFAHTLESGLTNPCLRASFLACYASWVGRRECDQRLTDASHGFYVEALKETHSAIMAPATALTDSTLAACNALGIYEALECPGGTLHPYLWHRAACYRLIRARGPAAHQDGPAHLLFCNFRFFGILHALDNGEATYLAAPDWTDIPFQTKPKRKIDELLDIFALGPEASRRGRSIPMLPPEEVLPMALSIVDRLLFIHGKLLAFYSRLEEDSLMPLYWEHIMPSRMNLIASESEDSDLIFPPALWFRDLDSAALLTLYWAQLTMIYNGLLDIRNLFQEHGMIEMFNAAAAELGGPSPETLQFMLLDRVRKVLQTIAFCTTSEALDYGPPRVLTQLTIVTEVIKHRKGCEAEYQWAFKTRKRLAEKYTRILHADLTPVSP